MSSPRIIKQLKENIDTSNLPITTEKARSSLPALPPFTISDDALVITGRLRLDDSPKLHIGEWENQVVVVKVYPITEEGEDSTFNIEAEVMRQLSVLESSYFVKCFGFSKNASHYRIVMEHVPYGDLLSWLMEFFQSNSVIPMTIAYALLKNIASAIEELHNNDVIHCDLKCENILLNVNYSIKLIDYEYSKLLKGREFLYHEKSSGTIGYAAPEVHIHRYYSKACDVFSFASIMYCLYENSVPWNDPALLNAQNIANMLSGQQPRFTKRTPDPIAKLIKKCWNLTPSKRPTMSRVSRKLDAFFENSASNEVSLNEADQSGCCRPALVSSCQI